MNNAIGKCKCKNDGCRSSLTKKLLKKRKVYSWRINDIHRWMLIIFLNSHPHPSTDFHYPSTCNSMNGTEKRK